MSNLFDTCVLHRSPINFHFASPLPSTSPSRKYCTTPGSKHNCGIPTQYGPVTSNPPFAEKSELDCSRGWSTAGNKVKNLTCGPKCLLADLRKNDRNADDFSDRA